MSKEITTREEEVLNLVSQGYTNKYIAKSLCISPRTVEKHILRIQERLVDIDSNRNKRVALALYGLRGNWLPRDFVSPSPRETQVLKLIKLGKVNKEIAALLGIELMTVKNHIRSLFLKFGATNRKQLVRLWDERVREPVSLHT